MVGRCVKWRRSQAWTYDAVTMRLKAALPGPVKELHPGIESDWPVDVPGGFCLDAIPPSVSNKVAIAASWAAPSLPVKERTSTDDYATSTVTLACGKSYRFAIGVATERDAGGEGSDYLAKARQSADVSDDRLVSRLLSEHTDAWASFWNKSKIELPPVPVEYALVQEWYYCMLYLLRSSTRVGAVPPGLFGPFSTTDIPSWGDQMTLDYNFEAVSAPMPTSLTHSCWGLTESMLLQNFWGTQTANSPELVLPYADTFSRLIPLAKKRASLKDWQYGGRPHIYGAEVACMGRGSR